LEKINVIRAIYFLGNKTVSWWAIGFSIVAAETSALTIIGVPSMAYGGNIAFLQMIIGYVIARIHPGDCISSALFQRRNLFSLSTLCEHTRSRREANCSWIVFAE
jgi:hypothetical protein